MKSILWLLPMLMLASISGCQTASGEFCAVASPIRPSVSDHLTNATKRQILQHDEYGAKTCGWKP